MQSLLHAVVSEYTVHCNMLSPCPGKWIWMHDAHTFQLKYEYRYYAAQISKIF